MEDFIMKLMTKAKKIMLAMAPVTVAGNVAVAYTVGTSSGATDGTEQLDNLLAMLIAWLDGPLGVLISIAALMVGLGAGIMNQSIVAVVIGIAIAAIVQYGSDIIQGVAGEATAAL
ncbi:hypothetical protein VYA_42390 (plasmid) [Vibrio alfacsensis]|nr:hypothetical protein [Vibrio sp. 04Ya108]BBM67564.1 hypothetical protein VA249_42100 [Vibrio alfacsensis]BCN27047.1 hypothetical protein VYA_42390 [Vibrio alfacsensis]